MYERRIVMEEEKRIFSANLRRLMDSSGIDRNKLADALDLPYTTITEWYSGNVYPNVEKIAKLADVLGVSRAELMEDYNSPKIKGIPVLTEIPAGLTIEEAEKNYAYDHFKQPRSWNIDVTNYFALVVSGCSGSDEYSDGDYIFFKKDVTEFSGKYCCISIDNKNAIIRKVIKTAEGGFLLQPLNNEDLPIHLTADDCISRSVKILGVASYCNKSIK